VMGVDRRVVDFIASSRPGAARRIVPAVGTKRDVRAIAAHLRVVRSVRPDILHAHLRAPWTCSYAIAAGLVTPGVRVVAVENIFIPINPGLQRFLKRRTSRLLAAHVAVGHRAARLLEEDVGLPHDSIRVIPNGVPPHPDGEVTRVVTDGPVVGSLGRLETQKGYDVLVRALPRLPGVTAVLVGDGAERERLERMAAELGVADRLRIVGWSDNPRSYLPGFDVFVLPSRFEGLPLSVLEAMHAGVPVVATDVASTGESLSEGGGVLVQPEDVVGLVAAVAELLRDDERRAELGARAREVALRSYTTKAMCERFVELYDEVAG
jgi:glycosyltransferase involved in cell wall biosynthesis